MLTIPHIFHRHYINVAHCSIIIILSCPQNLAPPNITSPIPNTRITALFPTTLQTTLQCTSTGTPLPTITWRTENSDTEISCAEVSQIITDDVFPPPYVDLYERCTVIGSPGHSELIINNPRVEDSGHYICVAENGILTTDEASVYLQVEGRHNYMAI